MATYTVKRGFLWKIAEKYLDNASRWKEIYNLNKKVIGSNPNLIYPGQVLTLPGTSSSTSKSSSSSSSSSKKPSTPQEVANLIPKYENPYEKQLQQFLASRPEFKPASEEEMLQQAKQYVHCR